MSDSDDRAVPPKLADTDRQIEAFRHYVSEQRGSIASSIDTLPLETVPHEMRERWLRGVASGGVRPGPVVERLAGGPTAEAQR